MNAIFSAQKAGVVVDCVVLGEPSTFLQQAAYLTGKRSVHVAGVGRWNAPSSAETCRFRGVIDILDSVTSGCAQRSPRETVAH